MNTHCACADLFIFDDSHTVARIRIAYRLQYWFLRFDIVVQYDISSRRDSA